MTDCIKVPDQFFIENQLSLQAVGLLCFLRSYSKKYKVKKTDVYNMFPKNKKGSVSTAWKELVEKEYIVQFRSRSGGRWDYSYFFNLKPFTFEDIEEIREKGKWNG